MQCEGKTKSGKPCKNTVMEGSLCGVHSKQGVAKPESTDNKNERYARIARVLMAKTWSPDQYFLSSLKDQLVEGRSLTERQYEAAAKVLNRLREQNTKQHTIQCNFVNGSGRCTTKVTGTAIELGQARNRCMEHRS